MKITAFLLKFAMLSNICICYGKTYQSDHHHIKQHLDQIIHEKQNETPNKNEIITKLNYSDAETLAEVMKKEPKFFDEFERKYLNVF